MAYTLHTDNIVSDARWTVLAKLQEPDGTPDLLQLTPARRRAYLARLEVRKALLIAAYFAMSSESALNMDDGYITQEAALACCTEPWILKALLTPACGRPPWLHAKGQKCGERNCLDASPPWREGYEYRLCAFLKRNPSRTEIDRNRAQKKELADPTLREFVYRRDGGCCRYCRSGPLRRKGMGRATDRRRIMQVEHVDPDGLAGPDRTGVVLGCAACNEHKGRRTPDEADMVVLDLPSPQLIAYWAQRGEQQFDRPAKGEHSPADVLPDDCGINDGDHVDKPPDNPSDNLSDNPSTTLTTTRHSVVEGVVPGVVQPSAGTAETGPTGAVSAGGGQDNARHNEPEGSGSGRVGQPPPDAVEGPLGQPVRHASSPDIYTGRSRAPSDRPDPPEPVPP